MDPLIFLYWIVSHTGSFAALVAFLILYSRHKSAALLHKILFLAPLTLTNFSITIDLFLSGTMPVYPFAVLFEILRFAGLGMTIFALPQFCHTNTAVPFGRTADKFFIAAASAVTLFVCVAVAVPLNGLSGPAITVFNLFFLASVAYSMIILLLNSRDRMTVAIAVASLVSIPVYSLVDFFSGSFGLSLPKGLSIFPGFNLALNVVLLWGELRSEPSAKARPLYSITDEFVKKFGISGRETEVMRLLIEGKQYGEIGESLFISLPTVKTHITHIYRKTGAKNRVEIIHKLLGLQESENHPNG
jgi:DNA-binding CsgD family transcriptional regulator